jgi:ABC-type phosphate transport system substrate-binding protein
MRASTLLLLALLPGCFTLKPGTDTSDGGANDASANSDGGDCWDPSGFAGRGCFRCTPTTRDELLNACTASPCTPYDNSTLPINLDGGLPTPPPRDGSQPADMTAPPDLTSTDDGGTPDMASPYPACSSLSNGHVVYVTGSSAVQLFLGSIAQALENANPPTAVVYQSSGSCIGVNAVVTPNTTKMSGNATYWDPNPVVDPTSAQARLTCTLDPGGVQADVGLSDVFATTCLNLPSGLDPSIKDTFGPIETMNMVVPQNSNAHTISGEAAFLVWGYGGTQFPVMPWTDQSYLFQRNSSSGTQAEISATLGLDRGNWYGKPNATSGNVRDALIAAGASGQDPANKALGILSSDFADGVRTNIRALAFQDYKQRCAFLPDSSATSTDKRNVRDGHYSIFGPLHMLTHVNSKGVAVNDGAQTLLDTIAGVIPIGSVDIINLYAKNGLVPLCAMKVTRDADGGDIRPAAPATACNCYFEQQATGLVPPPGCTTCDRASDCPSGTPHCNKFAAQTHGYCEP